MDSKKKAYATMQNLSCNGYFAKRKTSEINRQIVACRECQKENTIYTTHRLISHLAPARKTLGGYHQQPFADKMDRTTAPRPHASCASVLRRFTQ